METQIKAQVHLVATNKLAAENKEGRCLFFNHKGQLIHYIQSISAAPIQHLYFTTDEEIKVNDWYIDSYGFPKIKQMENLNQLSLSKQEHPADKSRWKIVATTNSDLWNIKLSQLKDGFPSKTTTFENQSTIAKIDIPFIEAYIKAYNEDSPIKEVMLETLSDRKIRDCKSSSCDCFNSEMDNCLYCITTYEKRGLKLKPNGSVVTHAVKIDEREKAYLIVEKLFTSLNDEQFNEIKMRNEYGREKGKAFRIWFDKNY